MPHLFLALFALFAVTSAAGAADVPVIDDVEGQPLAANAERLVKALDFLGASLPEEAGKQLAKAIENKDAKKVQEVLDKRVLFAITINPEARLKVAKGPGDAILQQAGWTPVLVKVMNDSTVKKQLRVMSAQAGPVYSGPGQDAKGAKADPKIVERFLGAELFIAPPMTDTLSGLKVEYAIVLLYSSESGRREATIGFDIGQGNQDLGFRGETPVLFEVKPAVAVKVKITDFDGKPTTGRFLITDASGHIYPPQAKRLAPDLFFQRQVYRHDGGTILLPPGKFLVQYGRGPEYALKTTELLVPEPRERRTVTLEAKLERWINPADFGFFSGDHHIHAAGCAHYTNPTEGVLPEDMFLHVKGEGLNVGCCLTWGPCYDYQRKFFEAKPWQKSEPFTILKYDVEVSGFGSQALGHVCLLNLRDQTYPGSDGTKLKGWPTWTTPLMKWGKDQGAVTGYAHSANGLGVNPKEAAKRLFDALDANQDGSISPDEARAGKLPLPEQFGTIDTNSDGKLSAAELLKSTEKTANTLPNLNVPEMNGIGAQEVCVTTAMGVCDFISAMDTARTPEWNCWYHIMNCGFPLKASGETDFPCISGSRVGQGRVYVQLGKKTDVVDYSAWCKGIAQGRSYVSDGYAHALEFAVNGTSAGFGDVKLDASGMVKVTAKVAFAKDVSLGTAPGAQAPTGPSRTLELVVNGKVVQSKEIAADDKVHDVSFDVNISSSSWVAIRHFPQMHTNPVNVIVAGKPIRASKASAKWCVGVIEQLWRVRGPGIKDTERAEAEKTFKKALDMYKKIADESADDLRKVD
ncbi:EF hand [Gemmata sp. SH-PL17]|uniref:CehA/McbA family metallohydrolase n=1 Tax=Gemmata sp. SH-PL17 TaxID=1630693 RepID=UPI00078D9F05|nr:CehA/McbA family metallohydrolase [Gemmata sp. SH-PL17]AMV22927.1 EF hand [Gemmata sp. SH-PL17]